LTWDEVRGCELMFTAELLPARLAEHGDLLTPLLAEGHELPIRR
jgi:bifunctional non-homologous end joining protein LigD